MDYKFMVKNTKNQVAYVYMVRNKFDNNGLSSKGFSLGDVVYKDDIIKVYKFTWNTGYVSFFFTHLAPSKDTSSFVSDEVYDIVTKYKVGYGSIPTYGKVDTVSK